MKKAIVILPLFSIVFCSGQKAINKLTFHKGQQLEFVTNSSITSQSMMGPVSGTVTVTEAYSVNDVSADAVTLVKIPKRVQVAFAAGSQKWTIDTDNPKDLAGTFGEPIKEIMNQRPEFTIDASGKITAVKKDGIKTKNNSGDESNLMTMMLPGMNLAGTLVQEGLPSLFQVLPGREVGIGESWKDSMALEGSQMITLYKVKKITDKEIVLDMEDAGSTVTSQSVMGQTIDVNATTNGNGSLIIDRATGILKQKNVSQTTESTFNFMGREISASSKVTTVVTVSGL